MSDLDFWGAHVGRHFTDDGKPSKTTSILVPTNCKAGAKTLRLGSRPLAYFATEEHATVSGGFIGKSTADFTNYSSMESGLLQPVFAALLAHKQGAFVLGLVEKVSHDSCVRVSGNTTFTTYCKANNMLTFDAQRIRDALAMLTELGMLMNWMPLRTFLYAVNNARMRPTDTSRAKLLKLFDKNPQFVPLIDTFPLQVNSGEWQLFKSFLPFVPKPGENTAGEES